MMRLSFRKIALWILFCIFCWCIAYAFMVYDLKLGDLKLGGLEPESHHYNATNWIIDPYDYPVMIEPRLEICSGNVRPSMDTILLVHSAVSNILERTNYRTTMGKEWIRTLFGFEIMFVVGRHENPKFQQLIEQEAQNYGDILQGDFLDSYRNLSLKAVVWHKYIAEKCEEKNPFIVKTDDDVLVELKKMKEILLQYSMQLQNSYFCMSHTTMPILRQNDSKWYVPETVMSMQYKYYDEYCSGFAYVTSTAVIKKQWDYLRTHQVHYHPIDDFFVTGKLAIEANISHINQPSAFDLRIANLTESFKNNGTFFLLHNKSLRKLTWNKIISKWVQELQ